MAGPIDTIDRDRGRLRVLGQSVAFGSATIFGPGLGDMAAGDSITVSGFRRADGVVVATRIDKRSPTAPGILRAPFTDLDSQQIVVGDLRIDRRSLSGPVTPTASALITLVGPLVDGRFIEAAGRVRPRQPFGGQMESLSFQGFATRDGGGALQLQNMATEGTNRAVSDSVLVTFEG